MPEPTIAALPEKGEAARLSPDTVVQPGRVGFPFDRWVAIPRFSIEADQRKPPRADRSSQILDAEVCSSKACRVGHGSLSGQPHS